MLIKFPYLDLWLISYAIINYCFLMTFFFKINFSKKILSGALLECQMVWLQIRTDKMSVCKAVCKSFRHLTKVDASKERVKIKFTHSTFIMW